MMRKLTSKRRLKARYEAGKWITWYEWNNRLVNTPLAMREDTVEIDQLAQRTRLVKKGK